MSDSGFMKIDRPGACAGKPDSPRHLSARTVLTVVLGGVCLLTCAGRLAFSQAAQAGPEVDVSNFAFAPASLTVAAGATVTWVNHDEEPHTVVSASGDFRSGALDSADKFSFRFDHPGTYKYVCSIHPHMTGTIVVK
jgi:plastocyanin